MDDSCLVYHHKGVKENKHNLNNIFSNVCDFYFDNKLIIHFGDDKTKSRLFGTKYHLKSINLILDIVQYT